MPSALVFGDLNAAHIAAISKFAMIGQVIDSSDRIFSYINRVICNIDAEYLKAEGPKLGPLPHRVSEP